ncbi:hypothetical protein JCM6882_000243 [Rhodosporidiobolus microsporus]
MPEDTPRDELLPKSNRKFTLHFDDSLRLYLTETVRFPEPAAREQVGLLRGRLEAWLTYAYNKKLFIPYSVWEVKAVWGHLFDLGGNRRPENWTDNIHLVLTPVVEHKLARREWHQRLRLFKGATGMPTMYAIDGSTLHAHKRGFDPMKWMVVKSLQGVTINNPLANYIGLNAASFVRRSKRKQLCGRYFTFTDTFLEINLLYPGPSPSYYAGKPLRDYVTLENGTTYWQLRPVLDTRMVNTLSRMAAAQWLAPSGELSRGRQHPAPGALDIVCTFSGTELPSPTHSRAGGEAGGTSGPNPPPYFPTVDSAPGPTYRTDRRVVDVHGGGCEIVGKGTGEFRVDWAEVGSFFLGVMETSRIVLDVFQSMGRLMG